MYTRKFTASKLFAVVLAAAMLLTMTVSAFASEIQPYYDTEIVMSGSVDVSNQLYTVSVLGPTDITKIRRNSIPKAAHWTQRNQHYVSQYKQLQMF